MSLRVDPLKNKQLKNATIK